MDLGDAGRGPEPRGGGGGGSGRGRLGADGRTSDSKGGDGARRQSGACGGVVGVNTGLASGTVVLGEADVFDGAMPQDAGRAEAATVVAAGSPLSLQLVASPNPVRPGEQVNCVMTVANRGSTDLSGVKLRLA